MHRLTLAMASAEALYSRGNHSPSHSPTVERLHQPNSSPHMSSVADPLSSASPTSTSVSAPSHHPPKQEAVNSEHVSHVGEDVEGIPSQLIVKFAKTAKRLDLSYNRIYSLEGLDRFNVLEELVLDNNQLTDASLSKLPKMTHLQTLTLNKNQITDSEALLATLSKQCPRLHYLSLLGNQACPNELLGSGHDDEDYQRYRYYVLYKLPQLTFLDSRAVSAAERKEAKRVGEFMRVVKPSEDVLAKSSKKRGSSDIPKGYTPLPQNTDVSGQHRGVFGQAKYVYYGKHSEGNRFIRNNQL